MLKVGQSRTGLLECVSLILSTTENPQRDNENKQYKLQKAENLSGSQPSKKSAFATASSKEPPLLAVIRISCPEIILSIKNSMKEQSCTAYSKNILETEYFSKLSMEYLWVIGLLQPPTINSNWKCVINCSRNNYCLLSFPEHVYSDLE